MKCKNPYCKKEVKFMDWIFTKRCCIDCWMLHFELPKMKRFLKNPKNKLKFEEWKKQKGE